MNEKELRERFAARKAESQSEFERMMSDMNSEQSLMNAPLIDRESALQRERESIKLQINALQQRSICLNLDLMNIVQERKEINRTFHQLKHELIMMNPIEQFAKTISE